MNNARQRASDIIRNLRMQWARGIQAYFIAKHVNERRAKKRISSMVDLLNIIELSCQETTILTLSKLLIAQNDSITLPYLFNYAEQNPSAFPNTRTELLPDIISRHKEQLRSLEPIVADIRQKRSQTIAHLDKSHVINPSKINSISPLNHSEVEKAFRILHDMINEYADLLEPPRSIYLESLEPPVIEDVEYLTQLIEQDYLKNKK